jgi:hypothetical protein
MTITTPYFLSAHSFCCELEDGAIILELATGAYVGVHAEYLPDLRISICNWPNPHGVDPGATCTITAASEKLIGELLARRILTTLPTPRRSCLTQTPSGALTITDLALSRKRIPIRHIAHFAAAFLRAVMRRKDRDLALLLDWLEQRQRAIARDATPGASNDAHGLLASFLRLRIWFYTADRRCLFDSLVLAIFLTRQMVPCTFVIGISTKPFLAHSWLQIGEFVLNDTSEHVQMFTPILAIGENN